MKAGIFICFCLFLWRFSDVLGYCIGCSPGCLQIESSGYGVNVEYFAGKEQARTMFALQGLVRYGIQADSSAGNEFVTEAAFSAYFIRIRSEQGYQTVDAFLARFSPFLVGGKSCLFYQIIPLSLREADKAVCWPIAFVRADFGCVSVLPRPVRCCFLVSNSLAVETGNCFRESIGLHRMTTSVWPDHSFPNE